MRLGLAAVVAVSALLLGLSPIPGDLVSAQGQGQQSVAERCFKHHRFGAQPVDVAKSADGQTVLAQTSWNWHDAIGCYLTLDQQALAALRATPPPQDLPDAPTNASRRCFEHHKFGENPVDVAKTPDGLTVLARLSWGYHSTIGCYLTLDDTALATLRTSHTDDVTTGTDTLHAGPQFTRIASGRGYSCAIRTDKTIACWGNNRNGQIDAPPGQYTTITVGNSHSCAIKTDKTITCWGNSGSGQTYAPTGQYTAIAASHAHSCAIKTDKTITCWGANWDGQRDAPPGQYTTIAAAGFHSCAIKTDKTITCWGNNRNGQINAPTGQYTAIAASHAHSCAIKTDKTITCWGNNRNGQINAPTGQYTAIAAFSARSCAIKTDKTITCWGSQTEAPPGQFTSIAVGEYHSCAISIDQSIACWGNNEDWEGNYTGQADAPIGRYTDIAAGHRHTCAIKTDKTITCWGNNESGQANAPSGQYTDIAAGHRHTCAIRVDQTITCWGNNDDWDGNYGGQADAPTGQYTTITASRFHSCAIRVDQTITCWGNNQYAPTAAPSGQYTAIITSHTLSCAIRVDQTITCWDNSRDSHFDFLQSQFTVITSNGYSFGSQSCGVTVDQTVVCWTLDGSSRPAPSPSQLLAITPDDDFFDTWDREAVRASAFSEFNREEPTHGWTGDIDSCVAGTTSQPYRDSIFQRVNWYREMAGLDPVIENPERSDFAQHAALIMIAQGYLSHGPPNDSPCWTQIGYEAAGKSNLGLGRPGFPGIDSYIQDFGSHNTQVGHRRWILNRNGVEFGTGNIPSGSHSRVGSYALYVDPNSGERSNKIREERGFVAWPPPGYVPPAVNWGRWSFTLPDADFSDASVEVSDYDGPVAVRIIDRDPLPEPGIVWAMDGLADSYLLIGRRPLHSLADSDYCYTVSISRVKIGGTVQTPYEYAVCILTR